MIEIGSERRVVAGSVTQRTRHGKKDIMRRHSQGRVVNRARTNVVGQAFHGMTQWLSGVSTRVYLTARVEELLRR